MNCTEPETNAFYINAVGIADDGRSMERSVCITRADRYAIGYHVLLKYSSNF